MGEHDSSESESSGHDSSGHDSNEHGGSGFGGSGFEPNDVGTLVTRVLTVDEVEVGAQLLREGGLVAFPTETVYGLGADATNDEAIAKVYSAKGRPIGHPLIVHIADSESLGLWTTSTDSRVRLLADAFWPGPLTLILPRTQKPSALATGGRDTVGLRVPKHASTRQLLKSFGGGAVGPSANLFGHVSPTSADHVLADLGGRIDAVIDGGPAEVGIESTIVEIVGEGPVVMLRPGGISVDQLEAVLGEVVFDGRKGESRAAGMLASHYAPSAPVRLIESIATEHFDSSVALIVADAGDRLSDARTGTAHEEAGEYEAPQVGIREGEAAKSSSLGGRSTGSLVPESPVAKPLILLRLPADAAGFARALYAALREVDAKGPSEILIVPPRTGPMVAAVLDRLAKASAER